MTTETMREAVARAIARGLGDEFSNAFRNKERWTAKRGMSGGRFRDINEPFQSDYLDAADAAIRTVLERLRDADQMAMETAALVALAEHNVYTDVQEHIVAGDGRGRVAPGGLRKAIRAAKQAMLDAAAREVG